MKKRFKMSAKGSRRLFTKTAKYVHKKNGGPVIMRGGIRL